MAYSNNSNSEANSDLTRITGLWKNESKKDGSTYLAGSLGGIRVFIFPNKFKGEGSEKDPDYILSIAPAKPKEDGQKPQQRRGDFL